MSSEYFSSIGREEAISRLFDCTPYKAFSSSSFAASGAVRTEARLFLEGVDFDLVYFPLKHLGYKTVTAVSGKLYASLSSPRSLSVIIGVSAKLDYPQIRELWQGIVAATKEHGYDNLCLDLVPSVNGLSISLSATGECKVEQRPKAKSKDLLCISGNLSGAFLGLRVLEREKKKFIDGSVPQLDKYKMMVGSYLKPEIQPTIVSRFRETALVPSYGYLVDRGLADALKRLSRDSRLGVKVYADKLPFEGNSVSLCKELDVDPISAAMNGGEDYKLLFCLPLVDYETLRHDFQDFQIIGHLALPETGAVLVLPEGAEFPVTAQGW